MACDLTGNTACREILWNVSHPANSAVMYLLFAISMAICAIGVVSRVRLWVRGKPDTSRLGSWLRRIEVFLSFVIGQRGTNREHASRIFHTLIFWGFLVLLFTTTMVFLDHDLGLKIYRGEFYLAVTVMSDLFGLGLLFGIAYAYHRRYITQPDQLHSTRSDAAMLILLALLVVQGFALEGIRIAVTDDPWKLYSPIGNLVALSLWSISAQALAGIHFAIWWFHAITVFVFIALLPYTKFIHIISSSANLFFRELDRPKGALSYPGDIERLLEAAAESESAEFSIGVRALEDLTWKQRLDLDACTACGRCQDACPAYNSGKPLSPKWLILDTRDHMHALYAQGKLSDSSPSALFDGMEAIDRSLLSRFVQRGMPDSAAETDFRRAKNPLVQQSSKAVGLNANAALAGEIMEEDVFWSCTTCRACMEVCPVGIEHVDLIVDARRSLTLIDGALPQEAQSSLRAIETRGNPFGPAESRMDWSNGLDVRIVKPGESVDVLYWIGCVSAYDKRKQSIVRSMVKILNAAKVSWGILGSAESCTGDPARRLGEENLFQSQAKKNIALLNTINFNTVVANCPHCFNTIRNEYPAIGGIASGHEVRVIHHSELIKELLATKQLKPSQTFDESVTFHDPCYLGRYNDHYEEPREVLVQLGTPDLKEMGRNKEKGLCCGAGGGHFWMDMKIGERINTQRVNEAAETGASVVATGCPFCMQMLEDGIKLTDREQSLRVRDIAELVAEAL